MDKLRYLAMILLVFLCFSCKEESKTISKKEGDLEKVMKKAMLRGHYTQVNEDIGLLVYQNDIFYFNTNVKGFESKKFLLHLINEDNSFKNLDFFHNKFHIEDSLTNMFSDLSVVHKKIGNLSNYKGVRTGQFGKTADNKTEKVWSEQITADAMFNRKESYKGQLNKFMLTNPLNDDFKKSLELGTFFKNNNGFYVLLVDYELYLITDASQNLDNKMMLHFIRKDKTFANQSFNYENHAYQNSLDAPFNKLKIAKLTIPDEEVYESIRIGQFNDKGNLWTQLINLDEVYSNQLLKYNGEFEGLND